MCLCVVVACTCEWECESVCLEEGGGILSWRHKEQFRQSLSEGKVGLLLRLCSPHTPTPPTPSCLETNYRFMFLNHFFSSNLTPLSSYGPLIMFNTSLSWGPVWRLCLCRTPVLSSPLLSTPLQPPVSHACRLLRAAVCPQKNHPRHRHVLNVNVPWAWQSFLPEGAGPWNSCRGTLWLVLAGVRAFKKGYFS